MSNDASARELFADANNLSYNSAMKPCLYCGNNRIPHFSHKFYESLDILVCPIRQSLMQSWVGYTFDAITSLIGLGLFKLLQPIGLIKINSDIQHVPYDRAKVLWQEA